MTDACCSESADTVIPSINYICTPHDAFITDRKDNAIYMAGYALLKFRKKYCVNCMYSKPLVANRMDTCTCTVTVSVFFSSFVCKGFFQSH